MIHDVAIIFQVHDPDCEISKRHLMTMSAYNPTVPIIVNWPMPNAPTFHAPGKETLERNQWACGDDTFLEWFERRELDAERYIIFDWDTLVLADVRKFYAEWWAGDLVGSAIKTPKNPWHWWSQVPLFDEEIRGYALGVCPFSGVMISHRLALALSGSRYWVDGLNSELRVATLANAHCFSINEMMALGIKTGPTETTRPTVAGGIYHPIKTPHLTLQP